MSMIRTEKLTYQFTVTDENGEQVETHRALKSLDLSVEPGEFIAILGRNGSGKSTLAKHINALLTPTEGTVWIEKMDTRDSKLLWEIRSAAGMVFQNPDNQIVATVVEEDVGFGPENVGIPTQEIWERVEKSLAQVGMSAYAKSAPNRLSGGQKQRVAIAGVLAMRPRCIVFDESTAMLDPKGRREVLASIRDLNRQEKITVLLITHHMEEAALADRILVMQQGELKMDASPREIFSQGEQLRSYGLDLPPVTALAEALMAAGLRLPQGIYEEEELAEEILNNSLRPCIPEQGACHPEGRKESHVPLPSPVLRLNSVSYTYEPGTPMETQGLKPLSLDIRRGEILAIIGATGSGKSTLIQLMNGLNKPTEGKVLWEGEDVFSEGYDRRRLRSRVGLVFQYPEYQLFETDILKDICFGPKNQGLREEECLARARSAMAAVGLSQDYESRSPFDLSGGEKRRAAIAGVLAMEPDVLVVDEPVAGLDPEGRGELLEEFRRLRSEKGMGIVIVSHSMDDVAALADRILVLSHGEKTMEGSPREVFAQAEKIQALG
ncbi:MAG: energy-coupling factor transporter ATPase, partial [Lachnospiraceae bacterium]|nr:energy-coupling factor transporter ATPase [Lachnospiraceae bacterium]